MDRLSNILSYAQDCDVHVLEDLYTWLNYLAGKWRRLSRLNSAATAAAAAAAVKEFLIQKRNSQINFASGGSTERDLSDKRRRCL